MTTLAKSHVSKWLKDPVTKEFIETFIQSRIDRTEYHLRDPSVLLGDQKYVGVHLGTLEVLYEIKNLSSSTFGDIEDEDSSSGT